MLRNNGRVALFHSNHQGQCNRLATLHLEESRSLKVRRQSSYKYL